MARPPWRYSPSERQLHLIRHQTGAVAVTLCGHRLPVAELETPGDDDQERCPRCVRVFGTEVARPAA